MTVQTIVTPAGERLVILPEDEYRKLVEDAGDAADAATVEAFKRRLAAGEEELVPSTVVDRILAGESRTRVWRDYRGFTAVDLAERASVTPDTLSEIESGQVEGSVPTLRRIATALNLSIDDLVV